MSQSKKLYKWVDEFIETGRYFNGYPLAYTVIDNGSSVLFLRSKHSKSKILDLYQYDVAVDKETKILDSDEVMRERTKRYMSSQEKSLRERLRQTSGGVTTYSVAKSGETILCTVDSKPYLVKRKTFKVEELNIDNGAHSFQLSPDGKRVAYIKDQCLWVYDLLKERATQLTYETDQTNWGTPDFISAEELTRYRGYWWSPDSAQILVSKTDESYVQKAYLTSYINQKSEPKMIRYPFAGTHNCQIELYLITLNTGCSSKIWENSDMEYLRLVNWDTANIDIHCISRDQKTAQLVTFDSKTKKTLSTHRYTEKKWIRPISGAPCRWDNKLVNVTVGDQDSKMTIGKESTVIEGLLVDAIVGVGSDQLYFMANKQSCSTQRQLYVLHKDGSTKKLTEGDGYHSAVFKNGCLIISEFNKNKFTKTTKIFTHGMVNKRAIKNVAEPFGPKAKLFYHTLGARKLKVAVCMPNNFSSTAAQLPVIVNSYGGPGHQEVLSAGLVHSYSLELVQEGYAVMSCDGRGTPGRGAQWECAIQGDLATYALEDQIDALTEVCKLYPMINCKQAGIRGASFGGYLTLAALLRRPDIFKAGVAIAPVTDWSLYDTYYTEKYLGQMKKSAKKYQACSVINEAGNLKRPLQLVHGFADDNVLVSHSTQFFDRLCVAKKSHLCEMRFLDNQSHVTSDNEVSKRGIINEIEFFQQHLKH